MSTASSICSPKNKLSRQTLDSVEPVSVDSPKSVTKSNQEDPRQYILVDDQSPGSNRKRNVILSSTSSINPPKNKLTRKLSSSIGSPREEKSTKNIQNKEKKESNKDSKCEPSLTNLAKNSGEESSSKTITKTVLSKNRKEIGRDRKLLDSVGSSYSERNSRNPSKSSSSTKSTRVSEKANENSDYQSDSDCFEPLNPVENRNDDKRDQIFKNLENLEVTTAVEYLLTAIPMCSLPKSVNKRSMFVIDTYQFPIIDVKSDDNGSWRNNGYFREYFRTKEDSLKVERCDSERESCFIVTKHFYYLHGNCDFRRKIIRIQSTNYYKKLDRCLLCYFWADYQEGEIKMYAHGNSKLKSNPHVRTCETTLNQVNINFCLFSIELIEFGIYCFN